MRRPHLVRQTTILLVDNSDVVREITRDLLIEEGYRVLEANSAEVCLRILENQRGAITLLIADVCMPGTSGPQLARKVSSRYPATRILFISASPRELLAQMLPTSCHFLSKPFTRAELASAVKAALYSADGPPLRKTA